MRETRDNRWV